MEVPKRLMRKKHSNRSTVCVSWTLLWLVQYQINLLESNPNVDAFLSFTVIKRSDCINFKSTVQVPESSHFQILWRGEHFRSGIIYGTIWGSFSVLRSFAVQVWDHLRLRDHLRVGIIRGLVQFSRSSRTQLGLRYTTWTQLMECSGSGHRDQPNSTQSMLVSYNKCRE